MKFKITFISPKYYDFSSIRWWFFFYRKLKYARGFSLRICGVHMSFMEDDATKKIIQARKYLERP